LPSRCATLRDTVHVVRPNNEHVAAVNTEQSAYESLVQRIKQDLVDSYDEELELEIDDRFTSAAADPADGRTKETNLARQVYFRELLRLKANLSSCRIGSSTLAARW
jgi:hypothetical protein